MECRHSTGNGEVGREERSEMRRGTHAIYSLPGLKGCPADLAGLRAQKEVEYHHANLLPFLMLLP